MMVSVIAYLMVVSDDSGEKRVGRYGLGRVRLVKDVVDEPSYKEERTSDLETSIPQLGEQIEDLARRHQLLG